MGKTEPGGVVVLSISAHLSDLSLTMPSTLPCGYFPLFPTCPPDFYPKSTKKKKKRRRFQIEDLGMKLTPSSSFNAEEEWASNHSMGLALSSASGSATDSPCNLGQLTSPFCQIGLIKAIINLPVVQQGLYKA